MATVELRDIVTDADRAAAIAVQAGPGQDQFVASVDESLADAIEHAEACARYWTVNDGERVVGFAMISDGIPEETLAADPTLVGPYYLWRLLIDQRHQRRGYGTATLDAIAAYVRAQPGATELFTAYSEGDGNPRPFYERYGFVATDRVVDGERVLRLDLAVSPTRAGTLGT